MNEMSKEEKENHLQLLPIEETRGVFSGEVNSLQVLRFSANKEKTLTAKAETRLIVEARFDCPHCKGGIRVNVNQRLKGG